MGASKAVSVQLPAPLELVNTTMRSKASVLMRETKGGKGELKGKFT